MFQGCFNKVVEFLNGNIGSVGGSALGVAFFPLVGVILACCLAKNINKAKYEQMAWEQLDPDQDHNLPSLDDLFAPPLQWSTQKKSTSKRVTFQ